jgi:hypothetical protein
VMMDINDTLLNNHPNVSSRANWFWDELTAAWTSYGDLSYDLLRPENQTWDATKGMGRIYHYDGTYASRVVLCGGNWFYGASTGAFAMYTIFSRGMRAIMLGSAVPGNICRYL